MKKKISKLKVASIGIVGVAAVFFAAGAAFYSAGYRVNTSKSIPEGVYRITSKPLEVGDYVMFCPPNNAMFKMARTRGYLDSGFCPGNFGHLMKRVRAQAGDHVTFSSSGVAVNNKLLPDSAPIPEDGNGRPLSATAPGTYTLGPSQLLMMTENSPTSFDARYYGLVDRGRVTSVIVPIIQW